MTSWGPFQWAILWPLAMGLKLPPSPGTLQWFDSPGWQPLWLQVFAMLIPHRWLKPPMLCRAKPWPSYTSHPREKKINFGEQKLKLFQQNSICLFLKLKFFKNEELRWRTEFREDLLWQVCHKKIWHLPSGSNYASVRLCWNGKERYGEIFLKYFFASLWIGEKNIWDLIEKLIHSCADGKFYTICVCDCWNFG